MGVWTFNVGFLPAESRNTTKCFLWQRYEWGSMRFRWMRTCAIPKIRCGLYIFRALEILSLNAVCVTWPNQRSREHIILSLLAYKTLQHSNVFPNPQKTYSRIICRTLCFLRTFENTTLHCYSLPLYENQLPTRLCCPLLQKGSNSRDMFVPRSCLEIQTAGKCVRSATMRSSRHPRIVMFQHGGVFWRNKT